MVSTKLHYQARPDQYIQYTCRVPIPVSCFLDIKDIQTRKRQACRQAFNQYACFPLIRIKLTQECLFIEGVSIHVLYTGTNFQRQALKYKQYIELHQYLFY